MAWVEILPRYNSFFRRLGWDSADRFLSWTGILVNQHRHRQVEQVALPPSENEPKKHAFFLKKEFKVTWRDRMRNAWHGFGWCATAVREGATLQALREAGVGCPEVAALGEDDRRAFVLIRDESALSELRALLPSLSSEDRHCLADALGRELARMHDAGFDHPDLFAKHILAAKENAVFRFCIIDWQRSRWRKSVAWSVRGRDLALLDATLHAALASDRLRLRCLRAYRRACRCTDAPPLRKLAQQIRRNVEKLVANRNVRELGQAWVSQGDQQFVPLENGRVLVVRSYFEELGSRLTKWSEPEASAKDLADSVANASGSEEQLIHSSPTSDSPRAMPALAHTLFRLQRFGVPAPRLLAVVFSAAQVHLIARAMPTIPLDEAFAKASFARRCQMLRQAGRIVRQIHEAGYHLPAGDEWARRLGVVSSTGEVVLAKVEPLPRGSAAWREIAPVELNGQRFRLSRSEQLRFLSGYLRRPRLSQRERPGARGKLTTMTRVRERQAVP